MASNAAEIARLETELAEIREAISDVRNHGQSHGANGRTLTRADLRALREDEQCVEKKLSRARRGGIPVYNVVPRA